MTQRNHVVFSLAFHVAQLLVLCALGGTVATGMAQTRSVPPSPIGVSEQRLAKGGIASDTMAEPMVAVGVVRTTDDGQHVYIIAHLHGRAVTLILDHGTNSAMYLSIPALDTMLGKTLPPGEPLDSLTIGTAVESQLPLVRVRVSLSAPAGWPVVLGWVGTPVLAHYDFLFDGPRQALELYRPPARGVVLDSTGPHVSAPHWLPPGITPADCQPMPIVGAAKDHLVGIPLQVNGHAIPSFFDSGADESYMNLAAARLLGLTQHTPGVHLVPPDSAGHFLGETAGHQYRVTGLTLAMGSRILTSQTVWIVPHVPGPGEAGPIVNLGLRAFHDRRVFVSYSTQQICLSAPLDPRTP